MNNIDREDIYELNELEKVIDIYPWGQRVIRFYDPDFHIVEVGESMESVFKKFQKQGMSIDEVAQRTQHPVEFVKKHITSQTVPTKTRKKIK